MTDESAYTRTQIVSPPNIHEVPIDQAIEMVMAWFGDERDLRPSTAYIPSCVHRVLLKIKGRDADGTASRKMILHGLHGYRASHQKSSWDLNRLRVEMLDHPNDITRRIAQHLVVSFPSLRHDSVKITYRLPGKEADEIKSHLIDGCRLTHSDAISLLMAMSGSTVQMKAMPGESEEAFNARYVDVLQCKAISSDAVRYLQQFKEFWTYFRQKPDERVI